MKKLIFALCTIFCTALVVISIYTMNTRPQKDISSVAQQQYTVADFHGKIAVFDKGSVEPSVVYEIYTHLLPENDIELLRNGISVVSHDELQALLEDFGL